MKAKPVRTVRASASSGRRTSDSPKAWKSMFCSRISWCASQVSSPPSMRSATHEVPPAEDWRSRSSSQLRVKPPL